MWSTWRQIRIVVMKELVQPKNRKVGLGATASGVGEEVGRERETRIITRAT